MARANKPYPQTQYKQDKDVLVDALLTSFEKLRLNQQQATNAKVMDLASAADHAREVSVTIAIACLLAIFTMSLLITKSITRPIDLLKNKTREISEGHFDGRLRVQSPPEIAELAAAIDSMCEKLQEYIDRLKADFFASMSHELRTPLTSIKEGTGLLLDGVGGETSERQRKLLGILAEESNRLISLVNSLLDFSKMEAGMMAYDFETSAIDPLIKRAVSEITPLFEAKQIRLESALDPALPAVRLDPERMLQVLRNLLGNAVKFTEGRSGVRDGKTGQWQIEISVKDSGPGIPADSLISIFEKFNQGSRQGPHGRQGTGLGLTIAKSIITSHGGKIWAESQIGKGSLFIFVLPC